MTRIRNIWIVILFVVVLTRGEIAIELGKLHIPNLVLVRVYGETNHTNGECSTKRVSDIFPESSITLHTSESHREGIQPLTSIEPVLITIYNPELQQICERQRRKLRVELSEEPIIRILSTCYNCPDSDQGESIRFLPRSGEQSIISHSTSARLVSEQDANQTWADVAVHSIQSSQEIKIRIHPDSISVSTRSQHSETSDRASSRRFLANQGKRRTTKLPIFHSADVKDTIDSMPIISSIGVVKLSNVSESLVLPTTVATTRTVDGPIECSSTQNECCEDSDCMGANNLCVYQTCIDDGFPRFTLFWEGDDDIDLYVVTPGGFVLSDVQKYDETTHGRVGEPVVQSTEGHHVENIYFPLDASAPSGIYEFYVRPMTTVGMADEWTLVVSDENGEVLRHQGTRFSSIYTYVRRANMTLNPPSNLITSVPTDYSSVQGTITPATNPFLTPTMAPSSLTPLPTPNPSPSRTSGPTGQNESPPTSSTTFGQPYSPPVSIPTDESLSTPSFEPTCDLFVDECCSDSDCLFAGEICFNRNCIDNGNPRITLSWIGDDDLDLFVLTPAGKELSFMNFFDPISGGRFGEEVDQFGTGYHVENVYFPETGAPYGDYQFFVRPLTTVDDRDIWTLTVADHGRTMISETGTGISSWFSYFRERPDPTSSPNHPPESFPSHSPGPATPTPTTLFDTPAPSAQDQNVTIYPVEAPSRAPQVYPGGPPTRPPLTDTECNPFFDECCESTDCRTSRDVCEQRTCIRDGNPRFSLLWDGDDDLDLYVMTPDGVEISADRTFDLFSGGRFEMSTNQDQFGMHVENVYFPILGSPVGEFLYGVRINQQVESMDSWTLEVYEGGEIVDSRTGEGTSVEFPYIRNETVEGPQRPRPSPPRCSPISDECCLDSDCDGSDICVQRTCIGEGSPRITLRWTGDDDLNLFVEAPNGAVLSPTSQSDPISGGVHEADSDQSEFGFHVENVYFPAERAEAGTYKYRVESASTQGVGADLWKVSVYEDSQVAQEYSGIGSSREFDYERLEGVEPPTAPMPTSPPVNAEPCSTSDFVCCESSDCNADEICTNRNCVGSGSPRITLTWTGDDDFDLYVRTPYGDIISYNNRFDGNTQGVFDQEAVQNGYGNHVENVYFPEENSPLGNYSASVRLAARRDTPDVWTLNFYDGERQQLSQTGTGDSDFITYQRKAAVIPSDDVSTSPATRPSTSPVIDPITERPPPGQSPTQGDRICPHECCSDQDCDIPGEFCVQRTCIQDGTPRFTLTWTGNDNLSLVVITPGGETISHLKPSDPESGGVFAEDARQTEFGFHVENIIFPTRGGPEGEYSYFVKSVNTQGDADRWALRVFVDGQLATWRTGTGESRTFTYGYGSSVIFPTGAPGTPPPFTLAPVVTRPPAPAPTPDLCQMDADCNGMKEVCVQETCINDGNPRFTLEWSGNDDIDFFVETPGGVVISKTNPFDNESGGTFSEPGDQTQFGRHVENIYFPLGSSGTYKYYVRNATPRGSEDFWQASVSVDSIPQAVQSGSGESITFEFEFNAEGLEPVSPTVAPVTTECTTTSECADGKVCINQFCVENGNPRITLLWTGDDDLDLYVVTPVGTTISVVNKVDPLSSGRFGASEDAQTSFGNHVENIYFQGTAPSGTYKVSVKSFIQRGSADLWSIDAVANGEPIVIESGIGESEVFSFTFNDSTSPPASFPTMLPTISDSTCDIASSECCSDIDCLGNQCCTQRTCIDEGNPRFTLTWTGDDDLDLVVKTPMGTFVSFLNSFDESTGGKFGGSGDQFTFGRHVENIYFPLSGSPVGTYSFYVRSFLPKNEDDEWTVQVVVDGEVVDSTTGTGNSGTLTFVYGESTSKTPIQTPTMAPPSSPPESTPTSTPECNVQEEECCSDDQCITGVETCVQTQCIDLGNPRFTLTWTGDDDLDLKVKTPQGSIISFVEPLDEASGGVYGEDGSQFVFDKHVENIYFKEGPSGGAPTGVYTYSIDSFLQRGGNDRWTVAVFVDNKEVASQTGFGDSIEFTYDFQDAGPGQQPADSAESAATCSLNDNECCDDSDCDVSQEICVQGTCIDRGNPRFTLTWTGDDDLDLTVVTPFGTTLAVASPSDPLSGGIFGEEGDQYAFGQHVENIFFPLPRGPAGTYTFVVTSFDEIGTPDKWTVTVFVDDSPVLTKTGTKTSDFFVFEYEDGFTIDSTIAATPRSGNNKTTELSSSTPQLLLDCHVGKDECCSDSDCVGPMSLCVQRICIDEGNPRFTLTWNGNDDYNVLVTPPFGKEISVRNPVDFESGGRFGEDGVQSFPGLHAENVFFPIDGGPLGLYSVQVEAFQIIDFHDTWTVRVYVNGREVDSFSGTGDSNSLTYEYSDGGILRSLPLSKNETNSISSCSLETKECCVDLDCGVTDEKCLQGNCIPVRTNEAVIVLTWIGDDDLDLTVSTPSGTELSYFYQQDPVSGAYFEQSSPGTSKRGSQFLPYSERVIVPLSSQNEKDGDLFSLGTYHYKISSFNTVGSKDPWVAQVFLNGVEVANNVGIGDSDEFTLEISGELLGPVGFRPSPRIGETPPNDSDPQDGMTVSSLSHLNHSFVLSSSSSIGGMNECSGSLDCSMGGSASCIAGRCLPNGLLQFTLSWEDTEDLILSVWTPEMVLYQSTESKSVHGGSDIYWRNVEESSLHIESLIFSSFARNGIYKFAITTTKSDGASGKWNFWIHQRGNIVFQTNWKTSASTFFGFEYKS